MKTINSLILTAILLAACLTAACRNDVAAVNTTANRAQTDTAKNAVQPTNTTAPVNTNKSEAKPDDAGKSPADSMATPTETYKTAFAARQNKDVKALKKVLSKEILEFFAEIGSAEQKSLDDQLKTLADKKQAATVEVKNEKISGGKATLEYLDENGNWKTMDFVKESGVWKITFPDMK